MESLAKHGLVDISGKVNLPGGRNPIQRPPFVSKEQYFAQLDRLQVEVSDITPTDMYTDEYSLILSLQTIRRMQWDQSPNNLITAMEKGVERKKRDVEEDLSINESFWSENRIVLYRSLLSAVQNFISPDTASKLRLEDIPFITTKGAIRGHAAGSLSSISGVISLGSDIHTTEFKTLTEALNSRQETCAFIHELIHFYGTRWILPKDNQPPVSYRTGIATAKRFRRLNEGLTDVLTREFMEANKLDFDNSANYMWPSLMIEVTEEVMQARGIQNPRELFKRAYFGGKLRPLLQALHTAFIPIGGLMEYASLIERTLNQIGNEPNSNRLTLYQEWLKIMLSVCGDPETRSNLDQLSESLRIKWLPRQLRSFNDFLFGNFSDDDTP